MLWWSRKRDRKEVCEEVNMRTTFVENRQLRAPTQWLGSKWCPRDHAVSTHEASSLDFLLPRSTVNSSARCSLSFTRSSLEWKSLTRTSPWNVYLSRTEFMMILRLLPSRLTLSLSLSLSLFLNPISLSITDVLMPSWPHVYVDVHSPKTKQGIQKRKLHFLVYPLSLLPHHLSFFFMVTCLPLSSLGGNRGRKVRSEGRAWMELTWPRMNRWRRGRVTERERERSNRKLCWDKRRTVESSASSSLERHQLDSEEAGRETEVLLVREKKKERSRVSLASSSISTFTVFRQIFLSFPSTANSFHSSWWWGRDLYSTSACYCTVLCCLLLIPSLLYCQD